MCVGRKDPGLGVGWARSRRREARARGGQGATERQVWEDVSSAVLSLLSLRGLWLTVSRNGPRRLRPYPSARARSLQISEAGMAPSVALPVCTPFCDVSLQLLCGGEELISTSLGWPVTCVTSGMQPKGHPAGFPPRVLAYLCCFPAVLHSLRGNRPGPARGVMTDHVEQDESSQPSPSWASQLTSAKIKGTIRRVPA